LLEQQDSSRRLLIVGCFAAAAAFFTQNLFSFNRGGLWRPLLDALGFIPAMQRTWSVQARPSPKGRNRTPCFEQGPERVAIRRGGHGPAGLLALLAGAISASPTSSPVSASCWRWPAWRCWPMVLFSAPSGSRRGAFGAGGGGPLPFCVHSTRIWIADSFYKQGQVGIQINNPGFAAAMYQNSRRPHRLHHPRAGARPIRAQHRHHRSPENHVHGRLNPDQELYWVKMGIAFENAAAGSQKPDEKLVYYARPWPSTSSPGDDPITATTSTTRAASEIEAEPRQPGYF